MSEEKFEVIIPHPIKDGNPYSLLEHIELKDPFTSERKFILNRRYIAGREHNFEFNSEDEAIDFVIERIEEMRHFLKYVGKKPSDLIVNPGINSNGNPTWNVSLPFEKLYSVQANLICIFVLREV